MDHRSHSISKKISVSFHRPNFAFHPFCGLSQYGETPRIRNRDWEEDEQLKEDLKRYVLQNLSRREMLDFVSRDYAQYAWSLGTLSRRLAFFNVK